MKYGYYLVEMEEVRKEWSAFTSGSIGFFEHNKIAFGLTNAPATYQRLMQECLDDLIIFSRSNEEHLEPEAWLGVTWAQIL